MNNGKVIWFSVVLIMALAGCGQAMYAETKITNTKVAIESVTSNEQQPSEDTVSTYNIQGKLVSLDENGEGLIVITEDNWNNSSLCSISLSNLTVLDEQENSISLEQLKPGSLLDITYDGMIMEIYPIQMSNIIKIQTTGEEDCLIPLYLEIFRDFYGMDPGLNGEKYLALDMTGFSNLTIHEKAAFLYLMGNEYPELSIMEGTYESLVEEGIIISSEETQNFMYFPEGTLYSLTVNQQNEDSFTFAISKWASGMGAYGSDECEAKKDENTGEWNYEYGRFWIS